MVLDMVFDVVGFQIELLVNTTETVGLELLAIFSVESKWVKLVSNVVAPFSGTTVDVSGVYTLLVADTEDAIELSNTINELGEFVIKGTKSSVEDISVKTKLLEIRSETLICGRAVDGVAVSLSRDGEDDVNIINVVSEMAVLATVPTMSEVVPLIVDVVSALSEVPTTSCELLGMLVDKIFEVDSTDPSNTVEDTSVETKLLEIVSESLIRCREVDGVAVSLSIGGEDDVNIINVVSEMAVLVTVPRMSEDVPVITDVISALSEVPTTSCELLGMLVDKIFEEIFVGDVDDANDPSNTVEDTSVETKLLEIVSESLIRCREVDGVVVSLSIGGEDDVNIINVVSEMAVLVTVPRMSEVVPVITDVISEISEVPTTLCELLCMLVDKIFEVDSTDPYNTVEDISVETKLLEIVSESLIRGREVDGVAVSSSIDGEDDVNISNVVSEMAVLVAVPRMSEAVPVITDVISALSEVPTTSCELLGMLVDKIFEEIFVGDVDDATDPSNTVEDTSVETKLLEIVSESLIRGREVDGVAVSLSIGGEEDVNIINVVSEMAVLVTVPRMSEDVPVITDVISEISEVPTTSCELLGMLVDKIFEVTFVGDVDNTTDPSNTVEDISVETKLLEIVSESLIRGRAVDGVAVSLSIGGEDDVNIINVVSEIAVLVTVLRMSEVVPVITDDIFEISEVPTTLCELLCMLVDKIFEVDSTDPYNTVEDISVETKLLEIVSESLIRGREVDGVVVSLSIDGEDDVNIINVVSEMAVLVAVPRMSEDVPVITDVISEVSAVPTTLCELPGMLLDKIFEVMFVGDVDDAIDPSNAVENISVKTKLLEIVSESLICGREVDDVAVSFSRD